MQIRADALVMQLKKELATFYTLCGDELLLIQEAADAIRGAVKQAGFTERNIYEIDRYFDWSHLLGLSQSLSLFGEKQLIELRFPSAKLTKELAARLQHFIAQSHEDVVYLLIFPRLDGTAQKAAWFAALQKISVIVKIDAVDRAHLPAWITRRLASQKQSVDEVSLQFIVDRVEGNLLAAHQELVKLAYLYPEGALSLMQVQDSIMNVARYDVFKLNEAMLSGEQMYVARMLSGLKGEGEAPNLVLWALAEEVRTLLKIKHEIRAGKALSVALKEYRVWRGREHLVARAVQILTIPYLSQVLAFAARLDRQIKGVSAVADTLPADVWEGLFALAMQISVPIQRQRSRVL